MAIAVASSRQANGEPSFQVIGVDVPTPTGLARAECLNKGLFPFACADKKLLAALKTCKRNNNLWCTTDPRVYRRADVVVVDVPFHLEVRASRPNPDIGSFRKAIREMAGRLRAGTLVIVESTVPPGTCERVVLPELPKGVLLAHAYERVMPGKGYFDSIVNFRRAYAGHTPEAAEACQKFLSKVVNVKKFPLTQLSSLRASETAKVLENSYRAVNIAFMEEWGRFAEAIGIDLFEVISAVRRRPTHSNMRQPGFGVGGYCLTKDPLMAKAAARSYFGLDAPFPFCTRAVSVNRDMPLVSLSKARKLLGTLRGKKILLLGVSYRQDVADTRFSPSATFVKQAQKEGAEVVCHDPFVAFWPELKIRTQKEVPSLKNLDLIVFAVSHEVYSKWNVPAWLNGSRPAVLDANNVLKPAQRQAFQRMGCVLESIGRGKV
ncbi:MAG: nucleotide sugar dehydrogenase [Candidatus Omnitrophica bacterium]|nr:nucleotide sugar dehydrogenase [Candidatus Omnitrophota bacterium]